MPVVLRAITDLAIAAAAEGLACEDAVADFEAGHVTTFGDEGTRAFVRCCDWEWDWEDAFEVL